MSRRYTHTVKIGDLPLGSEYPIRLQSMTNTDTRDIGATVAQSIRIIEAGGEYVRITVPGIREVEALADIKKELHKKGFHNPLIADVHFNPQVAEMAARVVEKVRINPGNYVDKKSHQKEYSDQEYSLELERIHQRLLPLIQICKQYGTAIRIGSNHGSLSDRIIHRYGDSALGMVESAMEFLRIFEAEQFDQVILSMKASNVRVVVDSTRLLVKRMLEENMHYPLHLGVTEAGEGEDGRIKSAVGIGTLLREGIGDTVRVSLTEDPELEIPVANNIVHYCTQSSTEQNDNTSIPTVDEKQIVWIKEDFKQPETIDWVDLNKTEISYLPEDLRSRFLSHKETQVFKKTYYDTSIDSIYVQAACDFGPLFLEELGVGLQIDAPHLPDGTETSKSIALSILQACRIRMSKTEYISCPSCGRTLFDLQSTAARIRERTSHLKGLKIGIMGCIVNGPGEMADADYGYVGTGHKKITLYKRHEVVKRNIPEEQAVDELIQLIKENGDWKEPC